MAGAALAGVVLACAWIAWAHVAGGTGAERVANAESRPLAVAKAYAKLAIALKSYAARAAADAYDPLFDAEHLLGLRSATFVRSATLQDSETRQAVSTRGDQSAETVASLPAQVHSPPRYASLGGGTRANRAVANAQADKPTIFERLFGKPSPPTLAYAAADDSGLEDGQGATAGRYDRLTAVYDISAHTVYLPDGTALEAHSGRGSLLDDPRHADERDRGVTPPDVYDLQLRDGLFHGVQALRLIPVDDKKVFGRSGLLAHTYMLGPNGDSFGCVSFKDYEAFLKAYLSHEIKRLAVVAHLD